MEIAFQHVRISWHSDPRLFGFRRPPPHRATLDLDSEHEALPWLVLVSLRVMARHPAAGGPGTRRPAPPAHHNCESLGQFRAGGPRENTRPACLGGGTWRRLHTFFRAPKIGVSSAPGTVGPAARFRPPRRISRGEYPRPVRRRRIPSLTTPSGSDIGVAPPTTGRPDRHHRARSHESSRAPAGAIPPARPAANFDSPNRGLVRGGCECQPGQRKKNTASIGGDCPPRALVGWKSRQDCRPDRAWAVDLKSVAPRKSDSRISLRRSEAGP